MMAAKNILLKTFKNEQGQSILEVVLVLPIMFSFVALLYKINMASQMAINNTQIARSAMFVLTANSPEYPRLEFRQNAFSSGAMATEGHSRLVMGVADPSAVNGPAADNANGLNPIPQIQKIARQGTTVSGSQDGGEVSARNEIRVRNTVAICTQFSTAAIGGKHVDLTPDVVVQLGSMRWPANGKICKYDEAQQ